MLNRAALNDALPASVKNSEEKEFRMGGAISAHPQFTAKLRQNLKRLSRELREDF